jgi:hypothetical protein
MPLQTLVTDADPGPHLLPGRVSGGSGPSPSYLVGELTTRNGTRKGVVVSAPGHLDALSEFPGCESPELDGRLLRTGYRAGSPDLGSASCVRRRADRSGICQPE